MPISTITVAGISPTLRVLGATQQLNYDQVLSTLQITNSFVPTVLLPSTFYSEFRNNLFSGFRWIHLTNSTDTYGSLTLQNFVNAEVASLGNNMIGFNSSGINIFVPINLNSQIITSGTWNGNVITVPYGGTGVASTMAYSVLCGGTTSTGALQSVASLGTTGQVLTSLGAGALPIWAPTGIVAALYMNGNLTGTSVGAGAFTKAAGATTSAFLNNFTMSANNQLRYDGANTIDTLVTVNISASHNLLIVNTLGVSIFKNGTTQISPANYSYQPMQNASTSLTVSVYVQFANTNFVEVFVNSTAAATVLVSDMSLSVII